METRRRISSGLLSVKLKQEMKSKHGFTLIELLVVIAIIGILAALLFPTLAGAKNRAKLTYCLNNLKNINAAVHMYADEHDNTLPFDSSNPPTNYSMNYEALIKNYLGLNGAMSNSAIFACPADTFYYTQGTASSIVSRSAHDGASFNYSSYPFNAGNIFIQTNRWPGISGWKTSAIKEPAKTILAYEVPAHAPFSWHQPVRLPSGIVTGVNNAKNMLGFVDGHVGYTQIYWDEINIATGHDQSWQYDPPSNYDYMWSGN